MAATVGELVAKLTLDDIEFLRELERSKAETEKFSGAVKTTGVAAGAAFAGITAAIGFATRAAGESERAAVKLGAALGAVGKAFSPERAQAFSAAMFDLSGVEDDAVVGMQSLLATFNLSQLQTEKLIPGIADLSAALGMDLQSAARLVGRSIADGSNALSRYGVVMGDAEQKSFALMSENERLEFMVRKLGDSYGGTAEKLDKTLLGQLGHLKTALGDLVEEFGRVFTGLSDGFLPLADVSKFVQGLTDKIARLSPETKELLAKIAIGAAVFAGLTSALMGTALVLPQLAAGLGMIRTAMMGVSLPAVTLLAALTGILDAIGMIRLVSETGGLSRLLSGKPMTPDQAANFDRLTGTKPGDEPLGFFGANKKMIGIGLETVLSPVTDAVKKIMSFEAPALDTLPAMADDATNMRRARQVADVMDFRSGDVDLTMGIGFKSEAEKIIEAVRAGTDEYVLALDQTAQQADMIERTNDRVWTDVQTALLDADSSLIDSINGVPTMLGRAFNAAADIVGPGVANAAADFASRLGDALASAGDTAKAAGGALLDQIKPSGLGGGLIDAASMGFQAAGPMGALASSVGFVAMQTKAMQEIFAIFSDVVTEIVAGMEPLIEALKPMARLLAETVGIIFEQLQPVLNLLIPVFDGLFKVIKAVEIAILTIIKGIGDVWNTLVGAIASVFEKLARIKLPNWLGGGHPFGFMGDWADSVNRAKINTNGMSEALERLRSITETSGVTEVEAEQKQAGTLEAYLKKREEEAAKAAEAAAKTASALNGSAGSMARAGEAIANAPSGFKLAAARFRATLADAASGALAGAGGGFVAAYAGGGVNIQNVQITTNDATRLWADLKQIMARESVVSGGTPVSSSAPKLSAWTPRR